MVVMNPAFSQGVGRAYVDGGETDAVVISGGISPTLDSGVRLHIRIEMEETAGNNGTFQPQLQYNHQSGGWTDVTGSSSVVKATASATVADGAATTNRISGSGRSFTAGKFDIVDGATAGVTLNNDHTEFVFCVEIIEADISDTDSLHFRLRNLHADGDPTWPASTGVEGTVNVPTYSLPGQVHNAQCGVSPESLDWWGPHCDGNGVLWTVTEMGFATAFPDPNLWRSDDGGKKWTLCDAANRPTNKIRDMEGTRIVRSRLGPDTAGEVWLGVCHTSAFDIDYLRFFTDDHASTPNTWDTGATVEDTGTAGGDEEYVAVVERSDGDLISLKGQTISSFVRVTGRQQAAGTFGSEFNVDTGTASTNYPHAVMSLGNSDRVLVAYFDGTNNALDARDIPDNSTTPGTVASSINGAQTVKNYASGAMTQPLVDALQFDSTNDKHLVIWLDNSDKLWSVVMSWDGAKYTAGTPEQVSTTSVESDFPTGADTTGVVASMACDFDTGTVYVMYADATNRDIYRNSWTEAGGWGTEALEYSSTGNTDRTAYVMCNVFTHSAGNGAKKVLGWVWTVVDITGGEGAYTDGQMRYDEFEIPAAAAAGFVFPAQQLTTVRM